MKPLVNGPKIMTEERIDTPGLFQWIGKTQILRSKCFTSFNMDETYKRILNLLNYVYLIHLV